MVAQRWIGCSVCLIGVWLNLLLNSPLHSRAAYSQEVQSVVSNKTLLNAELKPEKHAIATFPNGRYQLCSEPDPQDWRDGAGVCFTFTKLDQQIEGYYGYPHSDSFVCIQGQLEGDRVTGAGLTPVWAGDTWPDIPQEEFIWDAEGHLRLGRSELIPGHQAPGIDWLLFHTALLDVHGFYPYEQPRMRPVGDLCAWQDIRSRALAVTSQVPQTLPLEQEWSLRLPPGWNFERYVSAN